MVIRPLQFNLILLLAFALLVAGCKTSKSDPDKMIAMLRVHLETNPLHGDRSERICVLRSSPVWITIDKYPFLSEAHLHSARVIETDDGHVISLKFNQQGERLLEQYSANNSYRRFAIRSQFRLGTNVFDRWIAAPVIPGRIASGTITFTPDADRTESDEMVRGWNNAAGYKPETTFSEVPE